MIIPRQSIIHCHPQEFCVGAITDLHKRSVINMGTKLYNKLPGYIKEIDSYKAFKKELKPLLLLHSIYSVEESVAL